MIELKNHLFPGFLVVFEGIDGSGKGTQIELLKDTLEKHFNGRKVVYTKEPGGTCLGAELRKVLFETVGTANMAPNVRNCLYLASHIQNVQEVIVPALKAGHIVVSDRYCYSDFAYGKQGGIADELAEAYRVLAGPRPDLVVYLNGTPSLLLSRALARKSENHQNGTAKAWCKAGDLARIQKVYDEIFSSSRKNVMSICVDDLPAEDIASRIAFQLTDKLRDHFGAAYSGEQPSHWDSPFYTGPTPDSSYGTSLPA